MLLLPWLSENLSISFPDPGAPPLSGDTSGKRRSQQPSHRVRVRLCLPRDILQAAWVTKMGEFKMQRPSALLPASTGIDLGQSQTWKLLNISFVTLKRHLWAHCQSTIDLPHVQPSSLLDKIPVACPQPSLPLRTQYLLMNPSLAPHQLCSHLPFPGQ